MVFQNILSLANRLNQQAFGVNLAENLCSLGPQISDTTEQARKKFKGSSLPTKCAPTGPHVTGLVGRTREQHANAQTVSTTRMFHVKNVL
jgi:hypothetical protein